MHCEITLPGYGYYLPDGGWFGGKIEIYHKDGSSLTHFLGIWGKASEREQAIRISYGVLKTAWETRYGLASLPFSEECFREIMLSGL